MKKKQLSFSEISCYYGCAKKIPSLELSQLFSELPLINDKNVVLSYENFEDVSAFRIDAKKLIVQTVDFMPPVVPDPYIYGEIATANALSDMYAKGVKPLFALSLIMFPLIISSLDDLKKIVNGAVRKAQEAEISIIGGHSIDGDVPCFGLTVTGISDEEKIITNSKAQNGDLLILTKPIGTGIILNAYKNKLLPEKALINVVNCMCQLNKTASDVMMSIGVNSATDITGFGLLGHLHEMMKASNTSAKIYYSNIPLIHEVYDVQDTVMFPISTKKNWDYIKNSVTIKCDLSEFQKLILTDPQTSGGLLISVPRDKCTHLLTKLSQNQIQSCIIGEVFNGKSGTIDVHKTT